MDSEIPVHLRPFAAKFLPPKEFFKGDLRMVPGSGTLDDVRPGKCPGRGVGRRQ